MAVVWLLSHVWPLDYSLWDFPDKNTGVGFHFLIQGIFLTLERLEVSYLKQSRWCWSDNQQSIWIWLSELTKLFLYVAASSLLSIKAFAPVVTSGKVQGAVDLWIDKLPFPSTVTDIWNKAKSPFHQPGLFIGFCQCKGPGFDPLSGTRSHMLQLRTQCPR